MLLNNKGRTMIEMITVVAILGIIAAVAYPMIFMNERILNRQIKESATRNDVRGLENFLKDDLRKSELVGARVTDETGLYSYRLTLAETDTEKKVISYKKEEGADGNSYLVREVEGQRIEFTDIEELELSQGDSKSRLVEVKITTLDENGQPLLHELKVARWQWLVEKENKGSQPGGVIDFIVNENVFVMGTKLEFAGDEILGPGATIFLTEGSDFSSFNGGNMIKVSNIYIKGNYKAKGNVLGSEEAPGNIIIDGNADFMSYPFVYGKVYIYGDLKIKDTTLFGDFYVDGDVEVHNKPKFMNNKKIYYTGTATFPDNYDEAHNYVKLNSLEDFENMTIKDYSTPRAKDYDWYTVNGYKTSTNLESGKKYFSKGNFTADINGKKNIVIVSLEGNIELSGGWGDSSGIIFAAEGIVTINNLLSFDGLIIAKQGLYYTNNGATLKFHSLDYYTEGMEPLYGYKIFASPADYPFVNPPSNPD